MKLQHAFFDPARRQAIKVNSPVREEDLTHSEAQEFSSISDGVFNQNSLSNEFKQ
jgi:hypothetical protein